MTSKELVFSTLEFRNTQGRVPRHLWTLPWATKRYPEMMKRLEEEWVWDLKTMGPKLATPTIARGDSCSVGEFVDEWGCKFTNIQDGVIGEVKEPQVQEDDWSDCDKVHIPEELLTFEIADANAQCEEYADTFTLAPCGARPFEQLQFIRGTENLYMDLLDPQPKMLEFMEKMHDFYCRYMKKWAQTNVDGMTFMDDWGSQNDLLISPELWKKYFMPMYRDYIDIAHSHGKKIFMHSDGNTMRIIPHLIDMGLDALNTQIFCIGVEKLAQFKGKITFWGEMDRQHLIPSGTREQIDSAVEKVFNTLWQDGGCIAQCEFGPGGNPDNVYRIYEKWNEMR